MILRCVWRPADHLLLNNVTAEVRQDDVAVPTRVMAGRAEADVDDFASSLRLVLAFNARVGAIGPAEVLRIDQTWNRSAMAIGVQPIFTPASYTILTGPNRRRRVIPGLHPLLNGGLPTVIARVALVDVTGLLRDFRTMMGMMAPRAGGGLAATPRILARTDGVLPQVWIVSTPDICQGFSATDVLCFLGPSQNHGPPPPLEKQLTDAATSGALMRYGVVILGTGTHAGPLNAIDDAMADHFTAGNIILAKGLENAVVGSGKHAILAIPVPANRSHNQAATAALPGLLADVHRLIHALGDAHPPLIDGEHAATGVAEPQYGLAAHSRGALAVYGEPDSGHHGPTAPTRQRPGALAAGPDAYSDIILFEGLDASRHTDALLRTRTTRISFIGFENSTVTAPFETLAKAGLTGRIHRFPVKTPSLSPDLVELRGHSPSLDHALSALPAVPTDRDAVRAILHQVCTWSGDDGGVAGAPEEHFLTQALKVSRLR